MVSSARTRPGRGRALVLMESSARQKHRSASSGRKKKKNRQHGSWSTSPSPSDSEPRDRGGSSAGLRRAVLGGRRTSGSTSARSRTKIRIGRKNKDASSPRRGGGSSSRGRGPASRKGSPTSASRSERFNRSSPPPVAQKTQAHYHGGHSKNGDSTITLLENWQRDANRHELEEKSLHKGRCLEEAVRRIQQLRAELRESEARARQTAGYYEEEKQRQADALRLLERQMAHSREEQIQQLSLVRAAAETGLHERFAEELGRARARIETLEHHEGESGMLEVKNRDLAERLQAAERAVAEKEKLLLEKEEHWQHRFSEALQIMKQKMLAEKQEQAATVRPPLLQLQLSSVDRSGAPTGCDAGSGSVPTAEHENLQREVQQARLDASLLREQLSELTRMYTAGNRKRRRRDEALRERLSALSATLEEEEVGRGAEAARLAEELGRARSEKGKMEELLRFKLGELREVRHWGERLLKQRSSVEQFLVEALQDVKDQCCAGAVAKRGEESCRGPLALTDINVTTTSPSTAPPLAADVYGSNHAAGLSKCLRDNAAAHIPPARHEAVAVPARVPVAAVGSSSSTMVPAVPVAASDTTRDKTIRPGGQVVPSSAWRERIRSGRPFQQEDNKRMNPRGRGTISTSGRIDCTRMRFPVNGRVRFPFEEISPTSPALNALLSADAAATAAVDETEIVAALNYNLPSIPGPGIGEAPIAGACPINSCSPPSSSTTLAICLEDEEQGPAPSLDPPSTARSVTAELFQPGCHKSDASPDNSKHASRMAERCQQASFAAETETAMRLAKGDAAAPGTAVELCAGAGPHDASSSSRGFAAHQGRLALEAYYAGTATVVMIEGRRANGWGASYPYQLADQESAGGGEAVVDSPVSSSSRPRTAGVSLVGSTTPAPNANAWRPDTEWQSRQVVGGNPPHHSEYNPLQKQNITKTLQQQKTLTLKARPKSASSSCPRPSPAMKARLRMTKAMGSYSASRADPATQIRIGAHFPAPPPRSGSPLSPAAAGQQRRTQSGREKAGDNDNPPQILHLVVGGQRAAAGPDVQKQEPLQMTSAEATKEVEDGRAAPELTCDGAEIGRAGTAHEQEEVREVEDHGTFVTGLLLLEEARAGDDLPPASKTPPDPSAAPELLPPSAVGNTSCERDDHAEKEEDHEDRSQGHLRPRAPLGAFVGGDASDAGGFWTWTEREHVLKLLFNRVQERGGSAKQAINQLKLRLKRPSAAPEGAAANTKEPRVPVGAAAGAACTNRRKRAGKSPPPRGADDEKLAAGSTKARPLTARKEHAAPGAPPSDVTSNEPTAREQIAQILQSLES